MTVGKREVGGAMDLQYFVRPLNPIQIIPKLCNYGVMTREPVEGFVLILSFGAGLHC